MCSVDWNAFGTWVLAGLTAITLLFLRRYVIDTRRLAEIAQEQLRNSLAPFVTIIKENSSDTDQTLVWRLINIGNGPAINVTVTGKTLAGDEKTNNSTPMAVGGKRMLSSTIPQDDTKYAIHNGGLTVCFEGIDGSKYETLHTPLDVKLKCTQKAFSK